MDKPFDNTVTRKASAVTPVGCWAHPLHPGFASKLAACSCDEDLFLLVRDEPGGGGHVNPDALREVDLRGLYPAYVEWDRKRRPERYRDEYAERHRASFRRLLGLNT